MSTAAAGRCGICGRPKEWPVHDFSHGGIVKGIFGHAFVASEDAGKCIARWEGGPHRWENGAPGQPRWCYYCEVREDGSPWPNARDKTLLPRVTDKHTAPREQEAEAKSLLRHAVVPVVDPSRPLNASKKPKALDDTNYAPTPSAPTALKAAATHPPLWVIVHEEGCWIGTLQFEAFHTAAAAEAFKRDCCTQVAACRIVKYVPGEGS